DGVIVHDQNGVRHRAPRRVVVLEFRFGTILLRTGKGPINAKGTNSKNIGAQTRAVDKPFWSFRERVTYDIENKRAHPRTIKCAPCRRGCRWGQRWGQRPKDGRRRRKRTRTMAKTSEKLTD